MPSQTSGPCHEIVIFQKAGNVSPAQLLAALRAVDPWLSGQPGFVSRAIRHDSGKGLWIDVVEWASRDEAMSAMQRAAAEPCVAALGGVIDPTTVQMLHGDAVAIAGD